MEWVLQEVSIVEEESPGGRPAESARVRRGFIVTERSVWNIPVTVADTQGGMLMSPEDPREE